MTKEPKPTEIVIENVPQNRDFPLPALRLPLLYHTARKIASIIFAKYPCRFTETEEGLLGTYPDGKQVLLTTDSIVGLILFSLTDQMVQDLKSELGKQAGDHDRAIRNMARYEEESKAREEKEARNKREAEARRKVDELLASISNIKSGLKRIPHSIDANQREINLIKQQGHDTPGQLSQYAPEKIQRHLDNIDALEKKYHELEKELRAKESELKSAEAGLAKLSA